MLFYHDSMLYLFLLLALFYAPSVFCVLSCLINLVTWIYNSKQETKPNQHCFYEHGPAERLTAPGSRVGFAERDASRPAFGGSSLVSLTRHTCVGGGPIGGALSVCPSLALRARSRQTTPAHGDKNSSPVKKEAKPPPSQPRAERSERVRPGRVL